ncbi:hypothetical protein D3C76_906080 [compost metagenome]
MAEIMDRMVDPNLMQIMDQGVSGFLLEQGADVVLAHHHQLRHRFDGNVLRVMGMNVLQNLLDFRVGGDLFMEKGQRSRLAIRRRLGRQGSGGLRFPAEQLAADLPQRIPQRVHAHGQLQDIV